MLLTVLEVLVVVVLIIWAGVFVTLLVESKRVSRRWLRRD
jgi:hypothetical protein